MSFMEVATLTREQQNRYPREVCTRHREEQVQRLSDRYIIVRGRTRRPFLTGVE